MIQNYTLKNKLSLFMLWILIETVIVPNLKVLITIK